MEKRIFENFVSILVHFLHLIIFLNVVLSVNVIFGHHFGKKILKINYLYLKSIFVN